MPENVKAGSAAGAGESPAKGAEAKAAGAKARPAAKKASGASARAKRPSGARTARRAGKRARGKDARKRPSRYSPQELRRRRLARRRVLFALAVLLIVAAIVFFLVLRNSNDISLAENGIGSLFSRAQMAVSDVTAKARRFTQRWHDYDRLEEDYEALQRENQQLSLQLNAAQESVRENERLQDLLGARSRYESLAPIYAKVIARSPGQWFETFSINRGTSDGVTQGMAVVNGDGLVGRVYEAGLNYAKVLCVIDARSSIAVMVQNTRDNGIMRGRIADAKDRAECYVYYLPSLNSVVPGDAVITSGTDSLFPKGLHIGNVTAVSLDGGSDGSYAIVTPSVDFLHLEEVFVLREVVETDKDTALPMVNGVQSLPNSTAAAPNATPTPTPKPDEPNWNYPRATRSQGLFQSLPEDSWARSK